MNLNYNSTIARMYRYFWANEEGMPDNLCPYFWKMLISIIFFIPLIICSLPLIIMEKIDSNNSGLPPFVKMLAGLVIYGLIFVSGFILYAEYHLILYWLGSYSYDSEAATTGGVFGVIGIIIFVIWYIKKKSDEINTPEFIDITREFISAKYHKYCPQIKWKK